MAKYIIQIPHELSFNIMGFQGEAKGKNPSFCSALSSSQPEELEKDLLVLFLFLIAYFWVLEPLLKECSCISQVCLGKRSHS